MEFKFICYLTILFIYSNYSQAIIKSNLINRTTTQSYNESLAKIFWDYSIISYCNLTYIQNWSCGQLCQQYNYIKDVQVIQSSDGTVLSYIMHNTIEDKATLVFRGSDNSQNWINNIDIIQIDYSQYCEGCKVHQGFFDSYKEIQSQLLTSVQTYLKSHNTTRLEIIGHSLGAALAKFFIADLFQNNQTQNIVQFYTFGCPRIGNSQFANWFNTIFDSQKSNVNNVVPYRIVHYHDIVVFLPPEDFGFTHTSTELWYTDENSTQYVICPKTEDGQCSDSVSLLFASSKDHTTYMGKVLENATSPCY